MSGPTKGRTNGPTIGPINGPATGPTNGPIGGFVRAPADYEQRYTSFMNECKQHGNLSYRLITLQSRYRLFGKGLQELKACQRALEAQSLESSKADPADW